MWVHHLKNTDRSYIKFYGNLKICEMDAMAESELPSFASNAPRWTFDPLKVAPHNSGLKAWESKKMEVDKILWINIIEQAQSECDSPIVLASEKFVFLRFCGHYLMLSPGTLKDPYTITLVDEYIDSIGEAWISSALEANSVLERSNSTSAQAPKTTCTLHHGLYRFIRIPFSLKRKASCFMVQWNLFYRQAYGHSHSFILSTLVYSSTQLAITSPIYV